MGTTRATLASAHGPELKILRRQNDEPRGDDQLSVDGLRRGDARLGIVLRTSLLLCWLYVVLLGGTWAVISSPIVRLVSQLLLTAVVGCWLYHRVRVRNGLSVSTGLDKPVVIFVAIAALATIFSANTRLSMEGFIQIAGYALLYYVLLDLTRSRSNDVLATTIGVAVIVAVSGLVEPILWYFGLAPGSGFGISWPSLASNGDLLPLHWRRSTMVMGNANLLAGYLAPLVPLGLGLALASRTRGQRLLAGLFTALVATSIAPTLSRGGMLALGTGLLAFLLLRLAVMRPELIGWRRTNWRWLTAAAIMAVLVALAMAQFLSVSNIMAGSGKVRFGLWQDALTMIGERPSLGFGPDTFGLALLTIEPALAGTFDFLPHPHNLYLGIGAEMGLLGLAAALWIGLRVSRVWWQTALRADRNQQLVLTGLMAGLVAMAFHGLVEDFRISPAVVVQGIAFIVMILAVTDVHRVAPRVQGMRRTKTRVYMLLGIAAAVGAFGVATSWSRWELQNGVLLADSGRWQEAKESLQALAKTDPDITFHRFQAALVKGWLAAGNGADDVNLQDAIQEYREALQQENGYALNHANLAALLWQAGASDEAMAEMRQAAALQPAEPRYRMNLAYYYLQSGREADARREYVAILVERPRTVNTTTFQWMLPPGAQRDAVLKAAWDGMDRYDPGTAAVARGLLASEMGQTDMALEQYQKAVEALPTSAETWEELGSVLAKAGKPTEAEAAFRKGITAAPARSRARALLAELLMQQNRPEEAVQEVRRAAFLEPSRFSELLLARIARASGANAEADDRYLGALPAAQSYVAYGLTTWRRGGIQHDSVPQLWSLTATVEDGAVYSEAAAHLADQGRLDEAAVIYRRWLAYDPTARNLVEKALERLGR